MLPFSNNFKKQPLYASAVLMVQDNVDSRGCGSRLLRAPVADHRGISREPLICMVVFPVIMHATGDVHAQISLSFLLRTSRQNSHLPPLPSLGVDGPAGSCKSLILVLCSID